eukprot:TRINITY_DN27883_c0_g1_i1.p1 TRINITY_DN27883_c0_g1~~TRINITY_DN27883_c0_g1_i1.p1  ORF type:complete len:1124 (+),score=406.20 TRINITY_DN27883_c0_g1_i1:58-3372(+)
MPAPGHSGTRCMRSKPAESSAGRPPPPQPPSEPAKPVVQSAVQLRCRAGAAPPPPPLRRTAHGGFPVARHRSTGQSYTADGVPAPVVPPETTPIREDPPPDPAAAAELGLSDDTDAVLQRAMDEVSAAEDHRRLAAAAVLLRSRVGQQRAAAFDTLLSFGSGVRAAVAGLEPTVCAQLLCALRMAADQNTAQQQRQCVSVLASLLRSPSHAEWCDLLESCDNNTVGASCCGVLAPLRAWRDETTLFGLGVAGKSADDPLIGVPEQELWKTAESVHQLASVVSCDLTDAVVKLGFASRLRWMLLPANQGGAGALPADILAVLELIAAGGYGACDALGRCPHLTDVVADSFTVSGEGEWERVSVLSARVLTSVARAGGVTAEAALLRPKAQPVARGVAVLHAAAHALNHGEPPRVSLCVAAARLLRVAALTVGSDSFPTEQADLVQAVMTLVRAPLIVRGDGGCGSWRLGAAALQLLGVVDAWTEKARGFIFADVPQLLESAAERTASLTGADAVAALQYCAALVSLYASLPPHLPADVADTQHLVRAARGLCAALTHGPLQLPRGVELDVAEAAGMAAAPEWPPCTAADRRRKSTAAFGEAALRGLLALQAASPAAAAAVRGHPVWSLVRELSEAAEAAMTPEVALEHAALPKQKSRIAAAARRAELGLAAAAWASDHSSDGIDDDPREGLAGAALNATLLLQPRDRQLWPELLSYMMPAQLQGYFLQAAALPAGSRSLWQRFTPGRLEPQPEWVWLPMVDGRAGTDLAPRRHMAVTTRAPPSPDVLRAWAEWLGRVCEDKVCFVSHSDWRHRALWLAGGVAARFEVLSADPAPLLPLIRGVCRAARQHDADEDDGGRSLTLALGEPPNETVGRLLQACGAVGCEGGLIPALLLVFLHPAFPPAVHRRVSRAVAEERLMGTLGGCFADGGAPAELDLGWRVYCGGAAADDSEGLLLASAPELRGAAPLRSARGCWDAPDAGALVAVAAVLAVYSYGVWRLQSPHERSCQRDGFLEGNVLYHRAVHRTSTLLFAAAPLGFQATEVVHGLVGGVAGKVLADVVRYQSGAEGWALYPSGCEEVMRRLEAVEEACGPGAGDAFRAGLEH